MAAVDADPERIEAFARTLGQFNARLSEEMGGLNAQFKGLGEFWRDDQFRRYADEFGASMRVMKRFLAATDEHIPVLRRKAEHLRRYRQS